MYGHIMYALTRNTGSLFARWLGYGLYVSTENVHVYILHVEVIYRFMYIPVRVYCERGEQ
jgi:hypothetical protein